jgi:hypothetical protein
VKAKVATKDKGKGKAKDVSRTASSARKVQIEDDVQDEDMDGIINTMNLNPATTSTTPFDFASFVPTHDPSLGLRLGVGVGPGGSAALPPAFGQPGQYASASASASAATGENVKIVSRDEAFQNALSSMYWTGYWTAAYYVSQTLLSLLFSIVVLELIIWMVVSTSTGGERGSIARGGTSTHEAIGASVCCTYNCIRICADTYIDSIRITALVTPDGFSSPRPAQACIRKEPR